MTLTRRVSALEADGDATERVIRWLAEAHAYDSIEAYTDHFLAEGPANLPMDRLPREAIAAIRARRTPRGADIDAEIREAIRAIVFRLHLVFRIIERATAAIEREGLVHIAMTAYVGRALEVQPEQRGPILRMPMLRDLLMMRVTELLALQEARERAEARYLAGTVCLFPAHTRQWDAIVHDMQWSAVAADRLVELDGGAVIANECTVPSEERVEACLADLVEMARIKTLDGLGEGSAAFARTRRWLEAKHSVPGATA